VRGPRSRSPRRTRRGGPLVRLPPQPQPCGTEHRVARGISPGPVPFYELSGLPVRTGRISCSIELLIEVLFRFPLMNFFAIGYHAFIFSLGWPAPPIFSQHSQADLLTGQNSPASLLARSCGTPCALGCQPMCCVSGPCIVPPLRLQVPAPLRVLGFGLGLIPLHSQLLGECQLISFPPLTNMLKFSG